MKAAQDTVIPVTLDNQVRDIAWAQGRIDGALSIARDYIIKSCADDITMTTACAEAKAVLKTNLINMKGYTLSKTGAMPKTKAANLLLQINGGTADENAAAECAVSLCLDSLLDGMKNIITAKCANRFDCLKKDNKINRAALCEAIIKSAHETCIELGQAVGAMLVC